MERFRKIATSASPTRNLPWPWIAFLARA